MNLLLHICCGPCSSYPVKYFKENNINVTGYFYNPNIHPFSEYKSRLNALIEYSKMVDLDVIYNYNYGLIEFTKNVINDVDNRCNYCYYSRMEEVVKYAKENNYDAFTSTLFVSPYQKHELLKSICEDLSKKYDIKFLYKDFRPNYKEGQEMFKKTGLYMQKYCGCVFSEFLPKLKEIESEKEKLINLNIITEKRIKLNRKYNGLNIRDYTNNDYKYIYDMKCNKKLNDKENKKLVNSLINDNTKIITLNNDIIGFYTKSLYLKEEYSNTELEKIIEEEIT